MLNVHPYQANVRILFLSPRQVLPARSGAKLREYHFLKALGTSGDVVYIYFRDPDSEALTAGDLPFCREVIGIPKPPAYGAVKTLQGILTRWPLPILNYTSAEMSSAVERATSGKSFDLVHLDSIHMIRYAMDIVRRNPRARTIYNWHNIESEAMRRFSETTASLPKRWYAARTASKLGELERGILKTAFGHIVCSERERAQLSSIAGAARIGVIGNGVDTSYFAGAGGAEPGGRRKLVFVGAMDYFPNSDGAVHFVTRIWPGIRARLGEVELFIVGTNPGPQVRALGELPGVTVTGMVPDLRPYYRGALAAVVPLRTGGGTRLKILEAMAAGVPVISTPLGAEGIDAADGRDILLVDAEDPKAWAERVAMLAESGERRSEMVEAGLKLVESRYDWDILGRKLSETYGQWLQDASER